jgi:hypothetical protein
MARPSLFLALHRGIFSLDLPVAFIESSCPVSMFLLLVPLPPESPPGSAFSARDSGSARVAFWGPKKGKQTTSIIHALPLSEF